ncbi:MAG: nitrilase-related carbon-nitrogen hydrolase [Chloroflexota bacterium]|nr:nitrilase-related carbon-nitrogen hydrolase [Chloroflexota bacterium]
MRETWTRSCPCWNTPRRTIWFLPEGALSGYAQDPTFLHSIDTVLLAASLRVLSNEVAQRQLHLVFGSCVYESGRWYNADLYYGPNRQQFVYRKVNLATSERGHFVAGSSLPVVEVDLGRGTVRLSIQLCREKGDFYEHSINHRRRIHRHRPRY